MNGTRRSILGGFALAFVPLVACAQEPRVYTMTVRRSMNCGCCRLWNTAIQDTGRFETTMTEDPEIAAHKRELGVPQNLTSCHTAQVEGYVIEGHVPAEDVLRLLRERPRDVIGLALPGMPLGSPGMEVPSGEREAFEVIAFKRDGSRTVFAQHAAVAATR